MGNDTEESCPVLFVPKLENWDLNNPTGNLIDEYRKVRDLVEEKTIAFNRRRKERLVVKYTIFCS